MRARRPGGEEEQPRAARRRSYTPHGHGRTTSRASTMTVPGRVPRSEHPDCRWPLSRACPSRRTVLQSRVLPPWGTRGSRPPSAVLESREFWVPTQGRCTVRNHCAAKERGLQWRFPQLLSCTCEHTRLPVHTGGSHVSICVCMRVLVSFQVHSFDLICSVETQCYAKCKETDKKNSVSKRHREARAIRRGSQVTVKPCTGVCTGVYIGVCTGVCTGVCMCVHGCVHRCI